MSTSKLTVFFPSAGRRVELLRIFKNAFAGIGIDGRIVAADINPIAPALRVADSAYVVPDYSDPACISRLVDICCREMVDLIFPLIDTEISALAHARKQLETTGARVVLIPDESVAIVRDKWLSVQLFRQLGLNAPSTWLPQESSSAQLPYPLFIKPRSGSASRHTFCVTNLSELKFFSQYVPSPIIQELLPGPEVTTDVVCDLNGSTLAVVSRRRLESRGGEVSKGVTIRDPAITEACISVARALKAVGPITIQCMMKDDLPYFTEVNARFGGGFPLGVAAGSDSVTRLLVHAAGMPANTGRVHSYAEGVYAARFDDSFFYSERDVAQISGSNI